MSAAGRCGLKPASSTHAGNSSASPYPGGSVLPGAGRAAVRPKRSVPTRSLKSSRSRCESRSRLAVASARVVRSSASTASHFITTTSIRPLGPTMPVSQARRKKSRTAAVTANRRVGLANCAPSTPRTSRSARLSMPSRVIASEESFALWNDTPSISVSSRSRDGAVRSARRTRRCSNAGGTVGGVGSIRGCARPDATRVGWHRRSNPTRVSEPAKQYSPNAGTRRNRS